MTRTLAAIALVVILPGCISKTIKKATKAVTPDEVVEKIAQGDLPGLVPIAFKVLNASQDFVVVHRDETSVIAEVRKIPGLGIALPKGDSRYYVRIDMKTLKDVADCVKIVLTFFKAAAGAFKQVMNPDSIVGKYAQQIFAHIFVALMHAGVAFK